jgi:hypothetical protein
MKKFVYYLLNCTWGIIMTLFGAIGALVMLCCGKKPTMHAGSVCFQTGKNWGGVSLGCFFFCDETSGRLLKDHEFGHSL